MSTSEHLLWAQEVSPLADADTSDLSKVHFDTVSSRLDCALHDYKEMTKRLHDDLDTAQNKLKTSTDEIKHLLAIVKGLKEELGASPAHTDTNQLSTALESDHSPTTPGPIYIYIYIYMNEDCFYYYS
jgi:predicted  nucleic acid-binding Zn-ribbon protein